MEYGGEEGRIHKWMKKEYNNGKEKEGENRRGIRINKRKTIRIWGGGEGGGGYG